MDDDFNTPDALAALFTIARTVNSLKNKGDIGTARLCAASLKHLGGMLGLLQRDPEEFLKGGTITGEGPDDAAIDAMVAARVAAKQEKNWAEADRIRDELKAQGILIEDGPQGTSWRRE